MTRDRVPRSTPSRRMPSTPSDAAADAGAATGDDCHTVGQRDVCRIDRHKLKILYLHFRDYKIYYSC